MTRSESLPYPDPFALIIRPLENALELADWAKREGFEDLRPEVWHLTVIRADCGRYLPLDPGALILKPDCHRVVTRMGGLVVLTLRSRALKARHDLHLQAGGWWDHSAYRPHVSFTPEDGRASGSIRSFTGALLLGPEIIDQGFA